MHCMPSILRRGAYVSCRRYDSILLKCTGFPVKQGGTADECADIETQHPSLMMLFTFIMDRVFFCCKVIDFFLWRYVYDISVT